jgi:hypothetical protein
VITALLAWVAGTALAGQVFVNGVRADVLPPVTLERCTVRVDAQGNIYIDAPGYKVAVTQQGDAPPVAAGMYGAPAPLTVQGPPPAVGPASAPVAAPSAAPVSPPVAAAPVPPATWWLVTEDARSGGQIAEVRINGVRVRTVRSGEPQLVLDVGPWLRAGDNTVEVVPQADSTASGGPLSVHLGKGTPAGGVLRMDSPAMTWTRKSGDPATPSAQRVGVR